MEGPRSMRVDELPSLSLLVDTVFTSSAQSEIMFDSFPALFGEHNAENCLVCADDGRVVSHFGMTERWACLGGCTVRVASVGAVATYDEYRGKGLATELFVAAREKALRDGVDFMIISGGRGLYTRAGAAPVGCDCAGIVDRVHAAVLGEDLQLTEIGLDGVADCARAYDQRPARFIRPVDDWNWWMKHRRCCCRKFVPLAIRREGVFRGYLVFSSGDKPGEGCLHEFAGDAADVAGALDLLMRQNGCAQLAVNLQQGDVELKAQLERAGVALRPKCTDGTTMFVNFTRFMRRMRPWFETRVGMKTGGELVFEEHGETFVFAHGAERLELSMADAVRSTFGGPDVAPLPGILGKVFPIPTLVYGLNYI